MSFPYDQVMKPDAACELLNISLKTLYTLERNAGLPVHRLGARGDRRYIASELLAWLAAQPSTRAA